MQGMRWEFGSAGAGASWRALGLKTARRGAFCQFLVRWIYYYGSNKSTGKETRKTHLCALY